jgi:hypothetical protein
MRQPLQHQLVVHPVPTPQLRARKHRNLVLKLLMHQPQQLLNQDVVLHPCGLEME